MTPPRYITTPPTPNSLPDPLNAYSTGDVGTLIRRPETADDIRLGVVERLISERLAPDALDEKLPKLPGIS
jgi:hypothetical protein